MTHTITVTAGDEKPSVRFECDAGRTDDCHMYPDSESWLDGDGQERFPHDKCWIEDWIDNDAYDYTGADALDSGWGDSADSVPNVTRTGRVTVVFAEDYVEWQWADTEGKAE